MSLLQVNEPYILNALFTILLHYSCPFDTMQIQAKNTNVRMIYRGVEQNNCTECTNSKTFFFFIKSYTQYQMIDTTKILRDFCQSNTFSS